MNGAKFLLDTKENATITLRQKRRVKLPDAIISTTAKAFNLELLTLDEDLAKIYARCLKPLMNQH